MTIFRTCGALSVAVALCAVPAPALAGIDPVFGGVDAELDKLCSDLQKPNDESGFVSYAENVQTGQPVVVVTETGPAISSGIGTATVGAITNYRNAHVNGQSVNIHAFGDRETVYAGGHSETTPILTTTTVTRSASCHVHKPTEGANQEEIHPGYQIAPNGLQTDGTVSLDSVTQEPGVRVVNFAGPWIDPNASIIGGQFVICNSPTKNPGTWRNQNGYNGQLGRACSTIWYNELGSTPSVSVPAS